MPATKLARPMGRARKEPDKTRYSGRLAIRLRELREQAGLSVTDVQQKLARAGFEISEMSLYAYERGDSPPSLDMLPAYAKSLGCKSVSELFPGK